MTFTNHMKGVCHERKGLRVQTSTKLDKEEDDVNAQHDADARRLGQPHLSGWSRGLR